MTVLVTGAGGFLGGALTRRLRQEGVPVRSLCRGDYPVLDALGVEIHRGDLQDPEAVGRAVRGCQAVFHVAAKAGVWGKREDFWQTNVVGTRNVLTSCRKEGVNRLIYTSTPSVIHAGGDVEGVDESAPYPSHFHAPYPETKAIAEREVLAANGPELRTVALRPHLIWGPGDTQLLPRILARARAGRLRMVGKPGKKVDAVYIDNAVSAHLLAWKALEGTGTCQGRAYFITNGEPILTADLINQMLHSGGLPAVHARIPESVAYAAGFILEVVYRLFRITSDPPMTRFMARQLATSHWYSIEAARRDLGYIPEITLEEGMRRLARWLDEERTLAASLPPRGG